MAMHVPRAPGFAQMLKDGAKVTKIGQPGGRRLSFQASQPDETLFAERIDSLLSE